MSRHSVKELLYTKSYNNDPPTNAIEFAKWLSAIVGEAPPEYRDSVWIELEAVTEYDCANLEIEIGYNRPETEEEKMLRTDIEVFNVAKEIARAKATLAKYGVKE